MSGKDKRNLSKTDSDSCLEDLLMYGVCYSLNGKHIPVSQVVKEANDDEES